MENNTTACKNCEEKYEVGFEFCPHCGQKTNEDLTVGVLFYNTISNYFSFDARFFKSFIPLMFKPGILAKRFIEGKRLLYLHPAQMYLFISVVFFFLFSFFTRDYVNQINKQTEKGFKDVVNVVDSIDHNSIDSLSVTKVKESLKKNQVLSGMSDEELKALDSVISKNTSKKLSVLGYNIGYDNRKVDSLIAINAPVSDQLKAMGLKEKPEWLEHRIYVQLLKLQTDKKGGAIFQAFIDSIPITLFLLLPIFALILKLFFWRRGSFAHHLVFSFYYYSFLFTVLCIILIANLIGEISDWIGWLIMVSTFFYLVLAIKHFYRQGYFMSFIKTCMVGFVYLIFIIPIAIVITVVGAFLMY